MASRKGGGRSRPWVVSPSYEAAIKVLVDARGAAGLSQRDLADRIGKPRSFVSKVENRERRLDIIEFIAVARGLGVRPEVLIETVAAAAGAELQF